MRRVAPGRGCFVGAPHIGNMGMLVLALHTMGKHPWAAGCLTISYVLQASPENVTRIATASLTTTKGITHTRACTDPGPHSTHTMKPNAHMIDVSFCGFRFLECHFVFSLSFDSEWNFLLGSELKGGG